MVPWSSVISVEVVPIAVGGDTGVTEPADPRRLGLSVVDKLAVTAFATGDHEALLEQVRARAEVLAGSDADCTTPICPPT